MMNRPNLRVLPSLERIHSAGVAALEHERLALLEGLSRAHEQLNELEDLRVASDYPEHPRWDDIAFEHMAQVRRSERLLASVESDLQDARCALGDAQFRRSLGLI
jgi:hypothetical protein